MSYFIIFKDELRIFQELTQNLQIFPFIFYCISNSLSISLKRSVSSHTSCALTVYFCLVFEVYVRLYFCFCHSHEINLSTVAINYTDYSWSRIQDLGAFWSQFALYILSFYWHPPNLLENKLKWFPYSCIHLYIFVIFIQEYSNIHIYICLYVPYFNNKITL